MALVGFGLLGVEHVVLHVGDGYHQHPHAAGSAVDDPRGNLDHTALTDGVLLAFQPNGSLAFQYVVQFDRSLVVVWFGTVDIHDVNPGNVVFVALAYQAIAPSAGASLAGRFVLVANQCNKTLLVYGGFLGLGLGLG